MTYGTGRRHKQPLDVPSAGSTFKRPKGYFAAALIDECKLKGVKMGGAQVSTKHAGFLINAGGATCDDVLRLAEHVPGDRAPGRPAWNWSLRCGRWEFERECGIAAHGGVTKDEIYSDFRPFRRREE